MGKKEKKAITVLENQRNKLNDISLVVNYDVWLSQTMSFVKHFFGENSDEYFLVSHFKFWETQRTAVQETNANIPNAKKILDNCIEVIKVKGVAKKEWKHILITTHPAIFWSVGIALLGFSYFLGAKFAANKCQDAAYNQSAYKNDSSHISLSKDFLYLRADLK